MPIFRGNVLQAGTISLNSGSSSPVFDVIITTQSQFDNLIANEFWNNASSVLFNGEFISQNHIRIPDNVKRVSGGNTTTITFPNLRLCDSTNLGALFRNSYNPDCAASIDGLEIIVTNGEIDSMSNSGDIFGFVNLYNVNNCKAEINLLDSEFFPITFNCFENCYKLTNCSAILHVNAASNAHHQFGNYYGFSNCKYLTNCQSVGNCGTNYQFLRGFVNCLMLLNCEALMTNTVIDGPTVSGVSGGTHGFFYCERLSNCSAVVTAVSCAQVIGFASCTNGLVNCTALTQSDCGVDYNPDMNMAFNNCKKLVNCEGQSIAENVEYNYLESGQYGVAFNSVDMASNCRPGPSSSTYKTWSGYNYMIDTQSCEPNEDGTYGDSGSSTVLATPVSYIASCSQGNRNLFFTWQSPINGVTDLNAWVSTFENRGITSPSTALPASGFIDMQQLVGVYFWQNRIFAIMNMMGNAEEVEFHASEFTVTNITF